MSNLPLVDGLGCWCETRRAFDGEPALFLDRDGVVVEETNYLCRSEDVRLIAGSAATIAACNRAGIPVVMVTNQAGIGRGYYDWDAFAAVQATISAMLTGEGAYLDGVLACAYHAEGRAPFDVADHPWRKPQPGMLVEAAKRMNLDLARSWIVGDKADDLIAGRTAGLAGGVLVTTGHGASEEAKVRALALTGFSLKIATCLGEALPYLQMALRR